MNHRSGRQFFIFILGTVAVLGGLFFLPRFFKRTNYSYRFSDASPKVSPNSVPLSDPLIRVEWGKHLQLGKKTSFEQVVSAPSGTLVNFWATWCPPCIEELPSLEMYHRQSLRNPKMPKLVLVSTDEGLMPLQQLLESLDFKPSFDLFLDRSGTLAEKMGSRKFPETYLVSPGGSILFKWIGPQDWLSAEVLEKLRIAALSQPAGQNPVK